MSEEPIAITKLNDFIFCPASIYFHLLEDEEKVLYQTDKQLNGSNVHKKTDLAAYSTKKSVLQGIGVYSERFNLYGKIDTFDIGSGILTERKKKIKRIYDGYIFQLYAQYFALCEMGYKVKIIRLYSMDDNKIYLIEKPEDNVEMFKKFTDLIDKIVEFDFDNFRQPNVDKCKNCIYEPMCGFTDW